MSMNSRRPVVLPTRYVVRDRYVPRVVPYIQPIVNVNRTNVYNVPRVIYRPFTRNVVVDRGFPRRNWW